MLTTDQKGAVAEAEIMLRAVKLGVDVYRPIREGGRYDLILDLGASLLRTQCKWAPLVGDVVVVRCYSTRRARDGLRKRNYRATELDAIAAFCPQLDRCYVLLPDDFDGHSQICLRVAPSRNNQRHRINWAERFSFDARLTALQGAIAQLGERLHGMQEVAGSSPAGST